MRTYSALMLFSALLLFSSCATIISGTRYPLHIRTEPGSAHVTVTNKKGKIIYEGKSPASLKVQSGAGYFTKAKYYVKLSLTGYLEKTVEVNFKFNGWYIGNILIGGALGMIIVDPLTGGMWKIADPLVDEKLDASTQTTLKISDINDIPENQRKNLIKI